MGEYAIILHKACATMVLDRINKIDRIIFSNYLQILSILLTLSKTKVTAKWITL